MYYSILWLAFVMHIRKFWVCSWIIVFQWIAVAALLMWQCRWQTWRFQRKPLPPFTWSTFYHCCSELVLCTYWVLGTALHLIRFPLTFRYGILDLLWPNSCIDACTVMGDVMCAPLQEDHSLILEYYCTKPQLQLHSCTLTGELYMLLQDIPR